MQEKKAYTGYNYALKDRTRKLQKNPTEQEQKLWFYFLRKYPIKFTRQRPIENYIADFYCSKAKLVIELDGNQHYIEENKNYDLYRTQVINRYGVEVIRFSNLDVKDNFEGVCLEIDRVVCERVGCERYFR